METTNTVPSGLINNHGVMMKSVIAYILEKGPAGIRPADRKMLESVFHDQDSRTFLNLEWERNEETHRASASLYIARDESYCSDFEDSEGNRWREYHLVVTTNWASYGSATPKTQMSRLALMTEITAFAQSILDHFPGPFHRLMKTAAQVKAEKEAHDNEETLERVKTFVSMNRTKMRVGQERSVDRIEGTSFQALPQGTWEVVMADGKRYSFEKIGTSGAYITRLS